MKELACPSQFQLNLQSDSMEKLYYFSKITHKLVRTWYAQLDFYRFCSIIGECDQLSSISFNLSNTKKGTDHLNELFPFSFYS